MPYIYIYIYARLETKYIALSLAAVVWDNASWTIDACYRQYMAMHHPCLHQINTVSSGDIEIPELFGIEP